MGRLSTPKQRANTALKIVRAFTRRRRRTAHDDQQQETSNDAPPSKYLKKIDRILNHATKAVFKKAGLNIDDTEDWGLLLPWLAWAMYGKNPGHPKRWNKKELRRLLADVAELRSKNTTLTEAACCAQLITDIHYLDMGVTKDTLRRRLQQAKKLDLKRAK
jgi:hypothetical protein